MALNDEEQTRFFDLVEILLGMRCPTAHCGQRLKQGYRGMFHCGTCKTDYELKQELKRTGTLDQWRVQFLLRKL